MKKKIIVESEGKTYSEHFKSVSKKLKTDRISYGILYNKVAQVSDLVGWKRGDNITMDRLFQAWWDMEHSRLESFPTYEKMLKTVKIEKAGGSIPLLAITHNFSYIDNEAINDGRLTIENNEFIDAGLKQSPYNTKQIHLAGLAVDYVILHSKYKLQTLTTYLFNNIEQENIQKFTVTNQTTDEIYSIRVDEQKDIAFKHKGLNIIRIEIETNIGTYECMQKIIVTEAKLYSNLLQNNVVNLLPIIESDTNELLTSDIPFKGYEEASATISYADFHIYYHYTTPTSGITENVLKKPIIITDGFDPNDGRSYKNIYNNFLIYGDVKLGEELRKKGFDIVVLNFPLAGSSPNINETDLSTSIPLINGNIRDGGADYIERNAFLLVKLIQTLNQRLNANGSSEKLVIVGPSMGGLISRYALAYMEKQNALSIPAMDHNCRLWISFDSPHNGANIPLAIQQDLYFFGHVGESQTALEKYNSKLRNPAARQMLIEQLDGLNGSSTFSTTFYNNLESNGLPNSNGWPQNLRKIALVNGSGAERRNTYSPGSRFIDGKGFINFFNIKVFEMINNFMPPISINSEYFRGRVAKNYFLGLEISDQSTSVTNNNSRGSMDAVQGGTADTQLEIKTQFNQALLDEGITEQSWILYYDTHCFIPTISALGFKNPNFTWYTRVDSRNLVCSNEIYFDDYYVPQEDQPHISLTNDSARWIIAQIDGSFIPLNCNGCTGALLINGPDEMCNTQTYTVDNFPTGADITWNVAPSNVASISANSNGSQVVVYASVNGTVILTGFVISGCGSSPISKMIKVGKTPQGDKISYSVNGSPGAFGIEFKYDGQTPIFTGVTPANYFEFESLDGSQLFPNPPHEWETPPSEPNILRGLAAISNKTNGSVYLRVRFKDKCGFSNWIYLNVYLG